MAQAAETAEKEQISFVAASETEEVAQHLPTHTFSAAAEAPRERVVIGPKGSEPMTSTTELILSSIQPEKRQFLQKFDTEFRAARAQRQQARSHRSVSSNPAASVAAASACCNPSPIVHTPLFDQSDIEDSIHESDWMSQEDEGGEGFLEVEGLELEERKDIQ